MATIKINDTNGCSHISLDITIGGKVHNVHMTRKELTDVIKDDDVKVRQIIRNASIYYRKRKAQLASHKTIVAEIEAKEFSL